MFQSYRSGQLYVFAIFVTICGCCSNSFPVFAFNHPLNFLFKLSKKENCCSEMACPIDANKYEWGVSKSGEEAPWPIDSLLKDAISLRVTLVWYASAVSEGKIKICWTGWNFAPIWRKALFNPSKWCWFRGPSTASTSCKSPNQITPRSCQWTHVISLVSRRFLLAVDLAFSSAFTYCLSIRRSPDISIFPRQKRSDAKKYSFKRIEQNFTNELSAFSLSLNEFMWHSVPKL